MDFSIVGDFALRIVTAGALGFVIGLERELTNKYAGLRTNILVCLGACLFTIISIYGFPTVTSGEHPNGIRDTARVAAQVVTGIGFIGGGTVLRHGATVFGLTTAATLWMAASIGMACGAGMYPIAVISTFICLVVLVSVRFFEKNLPVKSTKNTRKFAVKLTCANDLASKICTTVMEKYPDTFEITRTPKNGKTEICASIEIFGRSSINSIYKYFNSLENIEAISVEELGRE